MIPIRRGGRVLKEINHAISQVANKEKSPERGDRLEKPGSNGTEEKAGAGSLISDRRSFTP